MNFITAYLSKLATYFVQYRMRSTRILLTLVILLMLFTHPVFNPNHFFEHICDWTGYFFIIIACLGRAFSAAFICGTKNEQLSTQGPFSMVRNPLYVFSYFGTVGVGLLSGHVIIFLMLLALFFTYYPEVVKHEEAFLSEKFGAEYEAYCHAVPRWVPRQWSLKLPETITVYPALLLKTMVDSSLFFLVFPLVESIETLQKIGFLPTFFPLY